jgi:hypothetical protein
LSISIHFSSFEDFEIDGLKYLPEISQCKHFHIGNEKTTELRRTVPKKKISKNLIIVLFLFKAEKQMTGSAFKIVNLFGSSLSVIENRYLFKILSCYLFH